MRTWVRLAAAIGASTTIWTTALVAALLFAGIRFTPLWRVRDFPAASRADLDPNTPAAPPMAR